MKIIDFGTARGQNRRCHTVAGVVFAKPGYVAPEVANGDPGDARVDLYALGIMLWELCAGRRFLQGDAQAHMAAVARNQNDPPPIALSLGAPSALDATIARLTAFDRDARYPSSRAAARDLAALLGAAVAPLPSGERGVRARAAHLDAAPVPWRAGAVAAASSRRLVAEGARPRPQAGARTAALTPGGSPRRRGGRCAAAAARGSEAATPRRGRATALRARDRARARAAPSTRRSTSISARRVALKVDLRGARRRRRESRRASAARRASLASLSHEHLVKVHDFGVQPRTAGCSAAWTCSRARRSTRLLGRGDARSTGRDALAMAAKVLARSSSRTPRGWCTATSSPRTCS